MKNVIIRTGACIGCGACIAVDPDNFDFNDDGFAILKESVTKVAETNSLINAVNSCPTSAIIIEEVDETCECENNCQCKPICECENQTKENIEE